jgi:hypothetical protein
MPLDGERLVIEPRYPFAAGLMKANRPHETDGARVRNRWWSDVKRCTVVVIEEADGHITWGLVPGIHHLDHDLRTLGCSDAWGIEQESKALELLGSLVDHRKFKQYLLTGTFLERSKRSGITYMFRRLKPTVAIVAHGNATRILCTLCLHPVGYYEGSWAGALCASDDVIAHLQLMRADEHLYWRRANQHPSWVPQSGL